MSEDPTMKMLAEIDKDMADIEKAVAALQQQAAQANYPQQVETTTDRLAEIEGQAEPQPVQVREGRWRTRGGEVKYIKAGGSRRDNHYSWPWTDTLMCWQDNGFYHASKPSENDLVEYLGPIEPEPEPTITPDDVAAETINEWPSVKILRQELEATELALLEQQQRNEQLVTQGSQQHMQIAELQAQVAFLNGREATLGTRLEEEKAVTTKRLQQVEELRSEVSHVQRLWGESRRRVEELETLVGDLRNINATAEKSVEAAARQNADLQHRLDTVAAEWAQQAETSRRLQIELDAREQVPTSTDDRFEQGWDKGTARAVETIAEWTEPFRTCGSQSLSYHVMQNLPHIMRTLTGLTDEY